MNWGPYELDSLIHEGGGGLVVKGRISSQVCAIKIVLGDIPFSEQKLERLNRAASLSQHLIKYDRVTSLPSALVVQSRFYEAVKLTDLLRKAELSSQARVAIAQQVLDALVILHQSGLVHGDVRLENVMLTRSGRVILLDVDQSVELLAPEPERVRSRVGMNAITPDHVRGVGLTQKSDVFAFGSFCIELFTGLSPLVIDNELDYAQLDEPILPELSQFRWVPESSLNEILSELRACWAVDLDARSQSLEPMKALLNFILPDSGQAQIELAGAVASLFEEAPTVPVNFVLPQFENERIVGSMPNRWRSRLPWFGGLAASGLIALMVKALFFPSPEPLHPAIQWHVKEPHAQPYVGEIRPFLEREWALLLREFGRDGSSHHLSWSEEIISIEKVRSGRQMVLECDRDLCFLKLIPVEVDSAPIWHEPIPVGSSKKRWKAVLQRVIGQDY